MTKPSSPSTAATDDSAAATPGQTSKKAEKPGGFLSMGLIPAVLRGVTSKGYGVPSKIQRKAIPLIVAVAPPGSERPPLSRSPCSRISGSTCQAAESRVIVLSPTRDSAVQTLEFANELGKFTDLCISLLVGGDDELEDLMQNPDIIIATPDWPVHHLAEVEGMSLCTVGYAVFDEADSLFCRGFAEEKHRTLLQLSVQCYFA